MKIAIYMRLSKEDEWIETESNSISNQRNLLRKAAQEQFGECEITEYIDDGYTGTNFNRPAVQLLLQEAQQGKVDGILVKDFSRFSRDYIELGSYLERLFPFWGIRFLSISDHYDSDRMKTADLATNFKTLLYDLYSKDLSVKVKSALLAKKEMGEYACANVPFGYRKKETDKNQIEIVIEEAQVVRDIFDMALSGMSSIKIAHECNRKKVKTPFEYREMKRHLTKSGELAHENAKEETKREKKLWSASGVCRILRNAFYCGDMVYGETPKIHHNHHPAIIEREEFEQLTKRNEQRIQQQHQAVLLQAMIPKDETAWIHSPYEGRDRKLQTVEKGIRKHPLVGKVYCGKCGRTLRFRSGIHAYFECENRYVTDWTDCIRRMDVRFFEEIILYALETELQRKGDFIHWQREWDILQGHKEVQAKSACERLRKERKRLEHQKRSFYEEYVLKGQTNGLSIPKIQDTNDKISKIENEIDFYEKQMQSIARLTRNSFVAQSITNSEKRYFHTTAAIFIEKITLYHTNRLEILWAFSAN
ncbi:MAG: recombinase family protein [Lachnospiraceae bacterium]|jgi:DNA invertase Pin-like site-specific DNA recombinase|nr:recombinase family protein [Lachnospiraceae bacterium]